MQTNIAISIPTRGDVDVQPITQSLLAAFPKPYSIFYDNSARIDLQVFSRYIHASALRTADLTLDYIYTQDDDCIVDVAKLLNDPAVTEAIQNGQIVCNMPEAYQSNYKDTPEKLVGFGCFFPANLIVPTFNLYLTYFPFNYLILREADRIFTGLNTEKIIVTNHPISHLPHATSLSRMYRNLHHERYRIQARDCVQYIRSTRNIRHPPAKF